MEKIYNYTLYMHRIYYRYSAYTIILIRNCSHVLQYHNNFSQLIMNGCDDNRFITHIVFVKEVRVFFSIIFSSKNYDFFTGGMVLHVNIYTIYKKTLHVAIYEKNLYIFSANSALL